MRGPVRSACSSAEVHPRVGSGLWLSRLPVLHSGRSAPRQSGLLVEAGVDSAPVRPARSTGLGWQTCQYGQSPETRTASQLLHHHLVAACLPFLQLSGVPGWCRRPSRSYLYSQLNLSSTSVPLRILLLAPKLHLQLLCESFPALCLPLRSHRPSGSLPPPIWPRR